MHRLHMIMLLGSAYQLDKLRQMDIYILLFYSLWGLKVFLLQALVKQMLFQWIHFIQGSFVGGPGIETPTIQLANDTLYPLNLNELLSSHLGKTSGQIFNLSGPSTPNLVLSQFTIFGFWILSPKIFGGLIPAEVAIEINLKVLYLNEYRDKDPALYVFYFCKRFLWRNRFRHLFWGLFECHTSSLYVFLLYWHLFIINSVEFQNLTYKVINNQALSYVKDLVV